MSSTLPTAAITMLMCFLTAGLVFSAVRRRRDGAEYILFWRLSPRAQALARPMFFRGPPAELSRILLFAAVTLLFAANLIGPN